MKKLILSALIASTIATAQAQVSVSPVAGINRSCYTSSYGSSDFRARIGPCAGVLLDFPHKGNVNLQTGVLYKMNGYSRDVPTGRPGEDFDYKVHTLDVPIKLICTFNKRNESRLFVGLGPYIAFNVAASGGPGGRSGIPRADAGAGLNFGYSSDHGLLLCLMGQYGLVAQDDLLQMHNYNFSIVAGHTFKQKHKTQLPEKKSGDNH